MNLFRKKKNEDIYEIILPGEKSQIDLPIIAEIKQVVIQQVKKEHRTDEQIINVVGREEELEFLDKLF